MNNLDCACYVGAWPFHKTVFTTVEELTRFHKANGMDGGYVSSMTSIFYNDPYEAEVELARELAGTAYRQVLTLNPAQDNWRATLSAACAHFSIAAVKIVPCLHPYTLRDPCVRELCQALEAVGLPLFVVISLQDVRTSYLMPHRTPEADEIQAVLEAATTPLLLSGIQASTVRTMEAELLRRPNVFFDTANLKVTDFDIEDMCSREIGERMVYGSGAPLLTMKSSVLLVETADMEDAKKEAIFSGRAFR